MTKIKESLLKGKQIGEIFPANKFYPDSPKVKLAELIGQVVQFIDARIIEDFDTKYGKHDMVIIAYNNGVDSEIATTVCSGIVILKKFRKLILEKQFPIIGKIVNDANYYDVV